MHNTSQMWQKANILHIDIIFNIQDASFQALSSVRGGGQCFQTLCYCSRWHWSILGENLLFYAFVLDDTDQSSVRTYCFMLLFSMTLINRWWDLIVLFFLDISFLEICSNRGHLGDILPKISSCILSLLPQEPSFFMRVPLKTYAYPLLQLILFSWNHSVCTKCSWLRFFDITKPQAI